MTRFKNHRSEENRFKKWKERDEKFMKENNYNFVCSSYEQIDEQGNKNGKIIKCKKKVDYNGVLLSCPVGNSTVMYNVQKLGKFEVPNIRKRNDDALWLKMLKKEQKKNLRRHEEQFIMEKKVHI